MCFVNSDTAEILLKLAFNTNQSNNPLVCEPVLSKLNIEPFCKKSIFTCTCIHNTDVE